MLGGLIILDARSFPSSEVVCAWRLYGAGSGMIYKKRESTQTLGQQNDDVSRLKALTIRP